MPYGLDGAVWFGVGVAAIQRALESQPSAVFAMITPTGTAKWWPRYSFRFVVPSSAMIEAARRRRNAIDTRGAIKSSTQSTLSSAAVSPSASSSPTSSSFGMNTSKTKMTEPLPSAKGAARLTPYDRSERSHMLAHHPTSSLSAIRSPASTPLDPRLYSLSSSFSVASIATASVPASVFELHNVDRMAMGDLPIPEVLLSLSTKENTSGGGTGGDSATQIGGGGEDQYGSRSFGAIDAAILHSELCDMSSSNTTTIHQSEEPSMNMKDAAAIALLAQGPNSSSVRATAAAAAADEAMTGGTSFSFSGGGDGSANSSTSNTQSTTNDTGSSSGGGNSGGGGGYAVSESAAVHLYRQMRSWTMSEHLCVRRSPIHGWGLFLRVDKSRDVALIEYSGQLVRQPVADRREISYEEEARLTGRFAHMQGGQQQLSLEMRLTQTESSTSTVDILSVDKIRDDVRASNVPGYDLATVMQIPSLAARSDGSGSCYLFRLDDDYIVDATVKGSAARFINHSCEPNCYSRCITVDGEKRITLFSMRNLKAGEELTYNYQFAIEVDPALKIPCYCGSRSCFGTMN
jgi:hypothetical protein